MRDSAPEQSVLAATAGRYSSPSTPLLASSREPLCGDPEGWGPISDLRWDFTPCFLDVWIIGVALWGLLLGAGAIWYLLKKRVPQDVPKNWHFYAKL